MHREPNDLLGRVAIVTGASRGIGKEAANALCRRGATVFGLVRAPTQEPVQHQPDASWRQVKCDLRDPASIDQAVAGVLGEADCIDILVNCAGAIEPIAYAVEADPASWSSLIQTNLVAPFHLCHLTLPRLLQSDQARIINLSSGAATRPFEGWSSYCSSKAGLLMLTRCLDLEYSSAGLVAINFGPSVVDTSMQLKIRESGINRISEIPRDQLLSPSVVGGAIAFLAGSAGRDYAGQEVTMRDDNFLKHMENELPAA